MRRAMYGWGGVVALMALLGLAPQGAHADMPPPDGTRTQYHNVKIDLGAYAEVLPRQHKVAPGDTLGALAQRYLGTSKRWEEIAKANPAADPKKLLVGAALVIPAKRKALSLSKAETAGGPRHRWDFYAFTGIWNSVDALRADGVLQSGYHMGTWLIAVRHDKRAEFAKRAKDESWLLTTFDRTGKTRPAWTAVGPHATKTAVPDAEPVWSTLDTRRVTAIRDGRIVTERVTFEKLDAKGKVLTESEIVARKNKGAMVFIFLGLLGLVALVHVTMRRRRAAAGVAKTVGPTATTALLALALLLTGSATSASADIPVPGRRDIQTTVHLDFGPYADYTTRVHVVTKGETAASLPALATPAGLEAAATELRKGFDPKALKPGQRILYPPARAPLAAAKEETASAKHWWHIYSVPSPSMELTPFGSGQEVPVQHYGTTLIAVRHDHDAAFRTRYAEPGAGSYKYLRELEKSPPAWFARTNTVDAGRGSVKTASPVYRVEKRMRITSIAKGVIGTAVVATKSFGKDGKALTAEQIAAADRMNLILLLLAAAGLLGLVILLVRRSRARTTVAAVLLASLGLGLTAASADADVCIEPEFTQSTQIVLDFGALRERAVRVHHVAKGETLQTIAEATLGDAGRADEIQAANPEALRTELAVGYGLVIPPRKPDAAGWWHVFSVREGTTDARPIHDGERTPEQSWAPLGIVAVRSDGLAEFRERLQETDPSPTFQGIRYVGLARLKANPPAWFAHAPGIEAGRVALQQEHPVQRIEKHVRLEGVENGRLLTRVTSSRQFSAGGKELSRTDVVQHRKTRSLLYGLLAALGLASLAFVVARRRRLQASSAA